VGRQWIPAEQVCGPVRSLLMALPLDLEFAPKGQLATAIVGDAVADGVPVDFIWPSITATFPRASRRE
jgi:hypothetical protein